MALRGRAGPDAALLRRRALGRGVFSDGAALPLTCFRRHGAAAPFGAVDVLRERAGARDLQRRARAVGAHAAAAFIKRAAGLLRRARRGAGHVLVLGAPRRARARRDELRLALAALSCAAFYALLAKGVRGPLARGAAAARRGKDERIAAQLERAAVFFTVAWHGFPLVWGAGVLGAVGDARVRLGYVLCDVVAKFLPASIYVSLAVDP